MQSIGLLTVWRSFGNVNDKITNMAVEIVLILVPVDTIGKIGVRVDDGNAIEVGCGFEDWQIVCIANELGIVSHDQRLADSVGSWRKVDYGGTGR